MTQTVKETVSLGFKKQEMEEFVIDERDTLETRYTAVRSCIHREPDLDVLAPITNKDYKSASPSRKAPSKVTCTVVGVEATSSLSHT